MISLARTFAALADPTRRAMVARLARGEAAINELAAPFALSLPAVTKHLAVLERAGLLTRQKRGRVTWCRLDAAPMRDAAGWLAHYQAFWEGQFDALATYLEEERP